MSAFEKHRTKKGFTVKLWRGERMCLLGFDVEKPEEDFVGFAVEFKAPGASKFEPLHNRLAFDYGATEVVDGFRNFPSTKAPFQKFRWIHFPWDVKEGLYKYRVTKMHMPQDGKLKKGTSIMQSISLDPVTYHKFLDVGFTRNFASSQAFIDRLGNPADINAAGAKIIPSSGEKGLEFKKIEGDIYEWMGFEAYALVFNFLDDVAAAIRKGQDVTLDVFAYDFNEPDILAKLAAMKNRVRVLIDDSKNHKAAKTSEAKAAAMIRTSAGAKNVKRGHFSNLQHNKVFIARKDGVPFRVLGGSTNFTFRGLYIQANNAIVFDNPAIAAIYGRYFDAAFASTKRFSANELTTRWHVVTTPGKPTVQLCFSPHKNTDLSLAPVQGAIAQATSSVFYAVAFLGQMGPGLTKNEFDRLMNRPIFSYGVSDKQGSLEVHKPSGSIGLVDFSYLSENTPEPFKSEWSGGKGINIHHKFVVTDFNLPTAKVFTGSSNLSPSGEHNNGDHLLMIEDQRIATAYAIEALRMFDHLHFRSVMQAKSKKKSARIVIKLKKPKSITGMKSNWFDPYYVAGSQKEKDRRLFAGTE